MKFKYTFFKSNRPITSDRVRNMLSDIDDCKALLNGIRNERKGGSGIFKTKKHYPE